MQTSNKAKEITSVFEGLKGLIKLDLSYNDITDKGALLFAKNFGYNNTVKTLNLRMN